MNGPTRILVATDFSRCGAAALDHACELARQSHARLHLLHVIVGSQPGSADERDQVRAALERLSSTIPEQSELELETIKVVLTGISPHQVIVEYARDKKIELIVMGTHGRTGLAHLALGSVAERVLRNAPCPVLVLRPNNSVPALVNHAIESVTKTLGKSLKGSQQETVARVRNHIRTEIGLSQTVADQLVDELLRRGWITWSSEQNDGGRLSIMPGIEISPDVDLTLAGATTSVQPDSPAIDLIRRARRLRATDIHLDPKVHDEYSVRFRIDGRLESYCTLSTDVAEHLINRFKTLAKLDIAEPFLPKEARLTLPPAMADLEVRITTAPVASGEAVALRLFGRDNVFFPLDQLGHSEKSLTSVDHMLRRGEGLVLVTGPTGSGKSTTVYSMLESLPGGDKNIVSIEDPVEFAAPFIRQMNVDRKHGVTMASGLRTLLRMDPDVVFVGEIRDSEAAQIAMQAASSGRYVFSTLHTRDVASTITALRDMGIPDRSLSGNLTGIINQRLVRRLCPECRRATELTPQQRKRFESNEIEPPDRVYVRAGCNACRDTGYHGRIGIFESALVTDEVASGVGEGESEREIARLLRRNGVSGLKKDALQKAAAGTTDIEEALSVHWLT